MNPAFIDFRFGVCGRRINHPIPPDDCRLNDGNTNVPAVTDEDAHPDKQTTDEWIKTAFPVAWLMKISQSAYREMLDYFGSRNPEAAGLLLGPVEDDLLVTHFLADEGGEGTAVSFHINAPGLNRILKRVKPARINCKGIAHTHPGGILQPSEGDMIYVKTLLGLPANADAQQCFLPIVCDRRVYPYVYARGRLWRADLILV